jgi:general stress protein YciG
MANRNQGHNQDGSPRSGTSNRGFASMDAAQQREIARMGGAAVSGNREHMAQIGRKGGEASAESRASARSARAKNAPQVDDHGLGTRPRSSDVNPNRPTVHARARSDESGGQRAMPSHGRDEDAGNRMIGARGRDDAGRSLGSRSRDDDHGTRSLNSRPREDESGRHSLGGRDTRTGDDESARGQRGNTVGSPDKNDD